MAFRISLKLFGAVLIWSHAFGQTDDATHPFFIDNEVPRIDIIINTNYLQAILQSGNEQSNTEYPASFTFTSTKETIQVDNVGFRLRGNTSRYARKKSFKVSFNTFETGKKVMGIEKLNLNGEHNDPSIIRSKLCWDLLNEMGVPSPRANHVRLYINGQYYGLYINVEHIDENFVKSRFGNNSGNLYKCLYPADLTFRGADPNLYKFTANGYRVYDLKTNTELDNYSDLAQLIDIINRTPVSDLPAKLEPVFNVNNYLKYLAMEVLTGNWDGYSYNKNNFYLYKNEQTGRFEFIPYDCDNTFGIDWFNIDWATRNVGSWSSSQARPLTKNILAVDVYRKRYYFYLKQLMSGLFSTNAMQSKAFSIRNMINPYATADTYRPLDYGWSSNDFYRSYTEAFGGHIKYGLIPYVSQRIQHAQTQFSIGNVAPIISNVSWEAYGYRIPITLKVDIEDEIQVNDAILHFRTESGTWQRTPLKVLKGNRFVATIGPWENPVKNLSVYFEAKDKEGNVTREPLVGEYTVELKQATIPICINEVMTSNTNTYPDELGNYSDWIELYNYGKYEVSLLGMSISDTLGKPGKWALPNITIKPGEFILLWADGQPERGLTHLPFKLNRNGEEIGLFTSKPDGHRLIDGYRFASIPKNTSFGYYPNAVGLPRVLLSPTPGRSNIRTESQVKTVLPEIIAQPNPFTDKLSVSLSYPPACDYLISIFNVYGLKVFEKRVSASTQQTVIWEPQGVSPGIYLVTIELLEKPVVKLPTQKVIYVGISK